VTGPDVVVVGGGVVGLSVAWRLAGTGREVVVFDPAPGDGASWAAAGMLAPVAEAEPTHPALARLGLASLARWPAFAAELAAAAGVEVPLSQAGTLVVGVDDDDRRIVDDLAELHRSLGLGSTRVTGRDVHVLEPLLHPHLRAGLDVPGDSAVDPRAVVAALRAALAAAGVVVRREAATGLLPGGGVRTGTGDVRAGTVVVAAGAGSPALGVPAVPVRPVKGQIARLRAAPGELPGRTIRAVVHGSAVYLVPRPTGELVVGATTEELGWDGRVTGGALHDLLRDAVAVFPGVRELEFAEVVARHRPATPDNGPLIGFGPVPGVVVATGHHRNGVLLAPITAEAVVAFVSGTDVPAEIAAFGPGRFA
jgi:glycine oxidase